MYTSFYELKQEPFHVTPDPEFLFPSPAHKEALAAIIYGIEQRKGFVAITGEVGVGKTTILRSYLDFADRQNLKLIYIYNSNLTFDELITTVLQELGVAERPASTFMAVTRLHEELIEVYRRNQTVVLIIDEAQNTPVETLESLRMLSNLETVTEKLIQIMLIGQPEFDELLQQHRLRQLRQRIAIHARINPLSIEDSLAYLEYRIAKVALGTRPVFTKNALRLIADVSQGIPRNLNILSDNALITGFGYQIRPVNARVVKEVLADRGLLPAGHDPRRRRTAWIGAGAAAAAVAAAVTVFALQPDLLRKAEQQVAPTAPPAVTEPPDGGPANRAIASAGNWIDQVRRPGAKTASGMPPEAGTANVAPEAEAKPKPPPTPQTTAEPQRETPPQPAPRASTPAPQPPAPPAPAVETARAAPPTPAPAPAPPPAPPVAPEIVAPEPTEPPPSPSPEPTSHARSGAGDPAAAAPAPSTPAPPATTATRRAPPIPLFAPPAHAPTPPPVQRSTPSIAAVPRPAPEPPANAPAVPSVMMPSASGSGTATIAPIAPDPSRRMPAPAAGSANGLVRTVRIGDSLWTMAEDVYGFVSPNVLRQVQDANPHLRNINLLSPGQEIVFPRVPEAPDRRGATFIESPTGRN